MHIQHSAKSTKTQASSKHVASDELLEPHSTTLLTWRRNIGNTGKPVAHPRFECGSAR